MLNLYHIDFNTYGSSGFIALAENKEKALNLVKEKNPIYIKTCENSRTTIEQLTTDLTKSWLSLEFNG